MDLGIDIRTYYLRRLLYTLICKAFSNNPKTCQHYKRTETHCLNILDCHNTNYNETKKKKKKNETMVIKSSNLQLIADFSYDVI